MMKKSMLGAALFLGLSVPAFAQDSTATAVATLEEQFVAADALYALRDQGEDGGLANTLAARQAYQSIAKSATQADLVRAVEGVARTYYFQGEVLIGKTTDAEKKARKALFNECWKTALEPISPKNLGYSSPVYYYFRASCIAHEAEVSSVLERLAFLIPLNSTYDEGIKVAGADTFEGGGLDRVKAAVRGNPEAKGLPGVYDPKDALALVEKAIASQGDVPGEFFCENFYRKVITLSLDTATVPAAKALAAQTLTDFADYLAEGDAFIPETIRAETNHCLTQVEEFAAAL